MSGKYAPLRDALLERAKRGETMVTLRFDDLDLLVGRLPPSARAHREWWSNSSQPHGQASWRAAGWRVASVDRQAGSVRFEREAIELPPPARVGSQAAPRPVHHTRGVSDPEAFRAVGGFDIRVRATWRQIGLISIGLSGALAFPKLPSHAGLYRMTFSGSRARVYVGETDNLQRRAAGYRNPGPSQTTNIRLNAAVRRHASAGGTVQLDVATRVEVQHSFGDAWAGLDLSKKPARRLAENAALVLAALQGNSDIENLD